MTLPLLLEILGWLGAGILGVRAMPQAYKCWKQGHADGISKSFLWLWIFGQLFMLAHFSLGASSISMVVYSIYVLIVVSIIMWFKYFPTTPKTS